MNARISVAHENRNCYDHLLPYKRLISMDNTNVIIAPPHGTLVFEAQ